MKYRRKPMIREAEQFGGFYAQPYPPGVQMEDNSNHPERGERYQFYVATAHGRVNIERGDYIVKEPNGNGYYPCKADIFEREHELVAPPPSGERFVDGNTGVEYDPKDTCFGG